MNKFWRVWRFYSIFEMSINLFIIP